MIVAVGVEEGFDLLDPVRRLPAADAEQVLAAAAALGLDIHPELQRSAVEVATPVCTTLPELREQLVEQRRAGVEAILRRGTSAERQLAAGGLPAAVDQLIHETRADL